MTVGPVKAAAYRAFLDAAARLASLDGVITEPKIPVEVGGDAIVKGVLERFVARQRESQRADEEAAVAA